MEAGDNWGFIFQCLLKTWAFAASLNFRILKGERRRQSMNDGRSGKAESHRASGVNMIWEYLRQEMADRSY